MAIRISKYVVVRGHFNLQCEIALKLGIVPWLPLPVRLLLWDCDERSYSYYIEVSTNQQQWTKVIDRTRVACRWGSHFLFCHFLFPHGDFFLLPAPFEHRCQIHLTKTWDVNILNNLTWINTLFLILCVFNDSINSFFLYSLLLNYPTYLELELAESLSNYKGTLSHMFLAK